MWSLGIFISEMLGVFVLTFMTLFTILASKSSIIKLSDGGKKFFIAIGIGVSLSLAIVVAYGIAKANGSPMLGYVNPAVAVAHAIAIDNFDYLLSALLGEIAGAFVGSGLTLAIFMIAFSKSPVAFADAKKAFALPSENKPIIKTFLGETIASFIFIGIVIAIIFSNQNIAFIGLALILVLLTFGLRFNLIINVFATIAPMIFGLLITKPTKTNLKNGFKNVVTGSISNIIVATILGGIYLVL